MKIDVRTPASPGDFETSVYRTPKPPLKVLSGIYYDGSGTGLGFRYIEIQDDQVSGRETGISYRIYYLPGRVQELTAELARSPGFLSGAARAAVPVGSVEASSSTTTRFNIPDGPGVLWGTQGSLPSKGGWWFVRSVNRYGQMSDPSFPIPDFKVAIP